jgi:exonuclease III
MVEVLQYNLYEGCQEPKRLKRFEHWLKRQKVDVAVFNELNRWGKDEFQQAAFEWGFKYSFLFEMKKSPFFIGAVSKFPIEPIACIEEPFHHGLLHVKTNNVHFMITHLSPADAAERENESFFISEHAKVLNEPLAVAGDLNTLSPLDSNFYLGNEVVFAENEQLARKFLKNGTINYRPMEILLEAGLKDVSDFNGCFRPTVPTPFNVDSMHALPLRLDYILANPILLKKDPVADVVVNKTTEKLSDHYPICCRWNR